MASVYKYVIPVVDEFTILMPKGAEILHVATQGAEGHLWARVDPSNVPEQRYFKLRGTGHEVDTGCQHVGTFMLHGGALVFHLFEARSVGG